MNAEAKRMIDNLTYSVCVRDFYGSISAANEILSYVLKNHESKENVLTCVQIINLVSKSTFDKEEFNTLKENIKFLCELFK